jgi:hypothetical protein
VVLKQVRSLKWFKVVGDGWRWLEVVAVVQDGWRWLVAVRSGYAVVGVEGWKRTRLKLSI